VTLLGFNEIHDLFEASNYIVTCGLVKQSAPVHVLLGYQVGPDDKYLLVEMAIVGNQEMRG
jgi:hypothetical protein